MFAYLTEIVQANILSLYANELGDVSACTKHIDSLHTTVLIVLSRLPSPFRPRGPEYLRYRLRRVLFLIFMVNLAMSHPKPKVIVAWG